MKKMILLVVLLILSACTDYVAQIDDQIVNLKDTSGQAGETLTDSRDGQTYRTFIVGSQIWMAENLNYETSNSYCYDDKKGNCTKYGRLYTYSAATNACPSGWHLPSKEEWESLIDAVGGESVAGKMLKAKRGWYDDGNGENSIGFLALPGGSKGNMAYNEEYKGIEEKGVFWTSTRFSDYYYAYHVSMYYDEDKASVGHESVNYKFSVRCVRPIGGSLTDTRDSQTYKTVKIGDQEWMAENLNYETENSYCYNDSAEYCAKYGRLYTWAAAVEACPSGWHLPDTTEWNTLVSAVGGESIAVEMLKSASGWSDDGIIKHVGRVGAGGQPFREIGFAPEAELDAVALHPTQLLLHLPADSVGQLRHRRTVAQEHTDISCSENLRCTAIMLQQFFDGGRPEVGQKLQGQTIIQFGHK